MWRVTTAWRCRNVITTPTHADQAYTSIRARHALDAPTMKASSLRTRVVQLLMSVAVVFIAASPAAAQGANGFVYVLRNDTVVNGGSRIYGYRVEPATGLTAKMASSAYGPIAVCLFELG